jgi:hypothetical protein
MNYNYISQLFNRLPVYYVIFFGALSFILFIEIFNFNENLLIGGLFTIGTFTTILFIQHSFSKQATENILSLREKFFLRKTLIHKYRFFFAKIIYYYLIYFLEVRFNLITLKFNKFLNIISKKFNLINYIKIFNKIYFANYFGLYYIFEKNAMLFLWLSSIKITYNNL